MNPDTIIAPSLSLVKGEDGRYSIIERSTPRGSNRAKWTEKKKIALKMADKLIEARMYKRGNLMRQCGDTIDFTRCADCGHYHVARATLCRDRLCPSCSWRLALQRYAEMSRLMTALGLAYPEYHYSFVTLTVQNAPLYRLRATMERMQKCYNRLRQRSTFKKYCMGAARSIEITRNPEDGSYHPHYHIITMWAASETASAPKLAMSMISDWVDLARREGLVVSPSAQCAESILDSADGGDSIISAVVETFKYAVKPSDLLDIPASEVRKFAAAVANLRLISMSGLIAEYARKCEVSLETVDDHVDETLVCTHCRSTAVDLITYRWAYGAQGYDISITGQSAAYTDMIHADDDHLALIRSIRASRAGENCGGVCSTRSCEGCGGVDHA